MTFGGPGPYRSLVLDHSWSEPAASFPNRNPGPCSDSSAALAIQPSRRRHVSPTRRERAGQRRSAAAQRGSISGPCPALEIASFWLHLRSSALDPGAVESTLRARTGHTNLLPGHSPEIRHGELVVMHRHRPHRGMRNGHFGKPVWGMKAQRKCGHRHNGVAEPRPSFVTLGSAHRGRRTHVTLHPNRRS